MPGNDVLDRMQWIADPAGDAAVAAVLGPWIPGPEGTAGRLKRTDVLNAAIRAWQDNADIAGWRAAGSRDAALLEPLEAFLASARALPDWADPGRIARAESMFMDYGALSVTMLFCASLPECYVVPDLAAVLHATGQLEDRAEHRIRTTGAMIFPVMMKGGLTDPEGAGVAQVLKVRLIHAMVRNLLLRESPEAVAARARPAAEGTTRGATEAEGPAAASLPPLAAIQPHDSMACALHVHGWDFRSRALPNNQEELAYTLLTFSYVFLRGMRRLGIAFSEEEERDYLHAWNVAGHFLGIRRELMVDTMEEAAALFARMQARGREQAARHPDACHARERLAAALMDAMKTVFPDGPWKSFPVLLTRRLVEPASARDLGLDTRTSWMARRLFALLMGLARGTDAVARLAFPHFSFARLITRAIGYRLTCALLMSQTRELSVPSRLRPGIRAMIARWGEDPRASRRMNALEDRFTRGGEWEPLERPAP